MPKIPLLEGMLKEERKEDRWDWEKGRLWKEKVISNHVGAWESWDTSWKYPMLEMPHISIICPKQNQIIFAFN